MKYPLYEYVLIIIPTLIGILGGYWIVRNNWHRYGLLFFISGAVGTGLCYLFIALRFYTFPDRPLHGHLIVPALVMFTFIPFTVVAGVRYSPKIWSWKIPFYWVLVHLAIVSEMLLIQYTNIFTFTFGWDLWDSYTLWWLYYLIFEWLGGKIVPSTDRCPLHTAWFRYKQWGWIAVHVILIATIFTMGMYAGKFLWGCK